MKKLPVLSSVSLPVPGFVLGVVMLGIVAMPAHAADKVETGQKSTATLQVGMHYVVPPFVAGTKVRTPEAIDTALAEALAKELNLSLQAVPEHAGSKEKLLQNDQPRVLLVSASEASAKPDSTTDMPTGYMLAPMAIMRTDTDIKSWQQLKDRKVCVAEGGRYAGMLSARYGAQEMVYRAPADALLALRTGECDAAVHDETMLKALLKLPEWKKFSAQLTEKTRHELVFRVASDDAEVLTTLKRLTKQWKSDGHLAALNKTRTNDIAFEVYLDQTVPDCH